MKKKQTKHFVLELNKDAQGMGIPVCSCFGYGKYIRRLLPALPEEVAKTRRGVTCGHCRNTRVFRKLK